MSRIVLVIVALTLLWAGPAAAVQPDEMLKDPVLEKRARNISAGLRCLVCQNQSIDDSDASLARDLRILLRQRLKAGDSDAQAVQFLVDRYGEYVLLKPRFSLRTLALWLGPFALVLLAGFVAWRYMRASAGDNPLEAELTGEEKKRLSRLLEENSESGESQP